MLIEMTVRRRHQLALLALLAAPLCGLRAFAALGGDAVSVAADANELGATVATTPMQRYELMTISADNGLRLREYATLGGQVFAVTWQGPFEPDLRRLLGAQYPAYTRAVAALQRPGLQRSLRIVLPTLVVDLAGHLRAYSGRAYLPSLVPAGVTPAQLH
ncbi:MAG: DUF2844 domain-containing protein [Steroidobacteraceae bacterium]|nr:DUF2844 domain-containing protein [Steroidobacteraceae bacterium]